MLEKPWNLLLSYSLPDVKGHGCTVPMTMTAWTEARETVWPRGNGPDGPLPPLLLALTVVTGLVDAASYVNLGHVFVANMTGNVVFLGFAIGGAPGLSVWASLIAIGSFLAGSLAAGRLGGHFPGRRLELLRGALAVQLAFVLAATVLAVAEVTRFVLIAVLAVAMGIQNSTARKLAVPELTTTVLTMTLTGIAADSSLAGGVGSRIGRRILAVGAMLLGALIGALLAIHVDTAAPLAAAVALIGLTGLAAHVLANRPPAERA
jgi:uncharacterized membrane protein YoaK (UPF0700 family)